MGGMRFSNALPLASLFAISLSAQIEVVSDGKVGVGTTSPGYKLDVRSASTASQLHVAPTDTDGGGYLTSGADSSVWLSGGVARHDNTGTWFAKATTHGVLGTGNGNISFFTGTGATVGNSVTLVERVRIEGAGNVGIGTASPGTKLEIKGANVGGKGLLYINGDDHGFIVTNAPTGGVAGIAMSKGGTTGWSVGMAASDSSYYISEGAMVGSSQRLAIAAGGNVGIGTTSPGAKLDVNGGLAVGSTASGSAITIRSYSDGRNWGIRDDAGVDRLRFFRGSTDQVFWDILKTSGSDAIAGMIWLTNGAERMRLDSAGNLGIGTNTPSQKLDVAGSVKATSFIAPLQTYADFVFKPGYQLPALSEVEAHIHSHGHLPGIPSEAQARAEGIDLAAMQVRLLQKVEELTLHAIAQQKEIESLKRKVTELTR
jgi:hypothetical protein